MSCLFVFISFAACSQSGAGGQVLSRIEKGKWAKAQQIISKALLKDSLDVEAEYAASLLFLNKNFPGYQLDSSYHHLLASLKDYGKRSIRDKEKLKRFPIDSVILTRQKAVIEEAAFASAKASNTEEAYHYFIVHYPTSSAIAAATELRDEAAFLDALKINTHSGFLVFLQKYPSSHRAADAQKRYDKLLYEDRTRDERLKSYEDFVHEFPGSPYRSLAEQQILHITTANGSAASFDHFIKQYSTSKWVRQARDILFHLDQDREEVQREEMTDSLRNIKVLNRLYWVPFLKGGRYGFMDSDGVEKLAPSFDSVDTDYLCGDIRSDYLITSRGIISRSGRLLYAGQVDEVTDLGNGFLKVATGTLQIVIHKSGFTIPAESIHDANIVAGRFIAMRKESGWGIVSFTGKVLLPYIYEEITSFDDWIVLTKNSKKIVVTASQVGDTANKIALPQSMAFDEVRRWGENLCWVKNGSLEGVLNEKLEFVIPLDRQVLMKTSFGFVRTKGDQQLVKGIRELETIAFDQVMIQGQWMLTKQSGALQLFDVASGKLVTPQADSIWFERNIAMVQVRDSVRAWLNPHLHLDFNLSEKVFLLGRDSSAWMVVSEKNKKTIYNAISGQRLFSGDFDFVEPVSGGFFLLSKANRKGLADAKGKMLLPLEYDAIIQPEPGRLSLLKDKKFGLYDLLSGKWIRPLYERNVIAYNNHWFVAFKDGGWGFIDSSSKPAGKFQFNEVKFWNDTAAWVKENFQWKIYDIHRGHIIQDKIKDFRYVKKYPHEQIVIIHQDNYYGVISNRSGTLIPSTFTDIVNVGDGEKPMYFTEKHVEEADISVVIYYDQEGKVLRRQAFESSDEYERIYCTKR